MNMKEAKVQLKQTIQAYLARDAFGNLAIPQVAQRPLLLMGPPGIGKTAIAHQAAQECGIGIVAYTMTHHTRQSAIGLPSIQTGVFDGKEYKLTEYTMSEIIASVYQSMERTGLKSGILFLDEINCVSETLAPAMLQFLQCKTFGCHQLPEGWIVVAAGNPPEYNRSVRDFDIVTLDRLEGVRLQPAGTQRHLDLSGFEKGSLLSDRDYGRRQALCHGPWLGGSVPVLASVRDAGFAGG